MSGGIGVADNFACPQVLFLLYECIAPSDSGVVMDASIDKPRIIEVMRAEFGFVIRTINLLTPDEMHSAGMREGRSVKDILAHLSAWHLRLLGWLDLHRRGELVLVPGEGIAWDERHILNEQSYEANKSRGLQTIIREYRETHARVLYMVDSLSERELTDPLRFRWAGGTLAALVARLTYQHYLHHAQEIREWMIRANAGRRA